jgi:quercetin dioxygenase-like cupin family protein
VGDAETATGTDVFLDERGKLTLMPFGRLPFTPSRAYVLSEIPEHARRAGHASRSQHRFLIGISGRAELTLDDGARSSSVELRPGGTLHVPPCTWLELEALDRDVAVLVLADGEYDPADYVQDRDQLPAALATTTTSATRSS